ncbi:MAG TPA: PCRF domain-containing protein, partial [Campylobacteraceae bacterium]|nr:PCRF domain-containing protein [Campylobacteraceae bacterium]
MLKSKLQPFLDRYHEISDLLSSPEIVSDIKKMTDLSREQKAIEPIKEKAEEYFKVCEEIEENREMLEDKELGELAKEELKELEPRKGEIEEEIKVLLLPRDPNDD